MHPVSRYALVVLVFAGSVMSSFEPSPKPALEPALKQPFSTSPDKNIQLHPSTVVSNLLEQPVGKQIFSHVAHHLPVQSRIAIHHAGYQGTDGLIPNRYKLLMTIMLNRNHQYVLDGLAKLQREFRGDHTGTRQTLLFPPCFDSLTHEESQICLRNLFLVATNNPALIDYITIPLVELVHASMTEWKLQWQPDNDVDAQLNKFAKTQKDRLRGEIDLDKEWPSSLLYHLVDLRLRILQQSGGSEQAVQDAISATLCYELAHYIKPTINATPRTLSSSDFRQILAILRNYNDAESAWMDAARNVILHSDSGQSVPYNPFAGRKECYRLRPGLRDIVLGVRAHLPADVMAEATADLETFFSFNQRRIAINGPDAWSLLAEQLRDIDHLDIYHAGIKFAFLGMHLPQGFLQSNVRAPADIAVGLLKTLVRYWALESLQRRKGLKMAKLACGVMNMNGLMVAWADIDRLGSEIAKMTP